MRHLLVFLSILIPVGIYISSTIILMDGWLTRKQEAICKLAIIVSGVLAVPLPMIVISLTAPETNAVLVDKTFVPSGYMYNWDARQLEQRIERRETRYYFIVRKDDGRIVEERVDSATYVKTDVGERILVD
nr:MAG TPA: Protein of unknown function (DUF2500) [Crassvirales sp.]